MVLGQSRDQNYWATGAEVWITVVLVCPHPPSGHPAPVATTVVEAQPQPVEQGVAATQPLVQPVEQGAAATQPLVQPLLQPVEQVLQQVLQPVEQQLRRKEIRRVLQQPVEQVLQQLVEHPQLATWLAHGAGATAAPHPQLGAASTTGAAITVVAQGVEQWLAHVVVAQVLVEQQVVGQHRDRKDTMRACGAQVVVQHWPQRRERSN